MTVRECIEYYRENYCQSDSARATFRALENKFPILMNTELEDLLPAFIVSQFAATDLMGASKKNYLVNLSTAIQTAIKDYDLKIKIKLDGLIKYKKNSFTQEKKYLDLEDVKKIKAFEIKPSVFKAEHKKRARDLFVLMCLSGMAISDAFKFDPAVHTEGKWFTYNRTKTANSCLIPIIPDAQEIIDRYAGQWPLKIGNFKTFWNHCQWISDIVEKKVSAHTARHTMGCIFLEFGFSLETISSFLGHTDTKITGKIYAHVTKAKIEREMANIKPETMSLK